jgi:hypothetical protein
MAARGAFLARADAHQPELVAIEARPRSLAATRDRLERETWPRLGAYVGVDPAPRSRSGELPFAQCNARQRFASVVLPRRMFLGAVRRERSRAALA